MGIAIILQHFRICRWNCGQLLMANIHSRGWVNPQDSEVPNRSRCYPKPVHLLPDRQWEKGLLLSTSTTNHHSIDITSKRPWVHAFLFILASTVQGGQWKTSCFFFLSFYYLLLVVLGRASLVAQMVLKWKWSHSVVSNSLQPHGL